MRQSIFLLFSIHIFFVGTSLLHAEIVTRPIEYNHQGTLLQGFISFNDDLVGDHNLPGVLVVHEWKGLGDYAKMRAEMLAKEGYVAFAVDMYGKGVFAENHEEAANLAGLFRNDRQLMRERVYEGLKVLLSQNFVNPEKIAAIGYCFGGTTVLEMARAGFPITGVISFHGGLATPSPAVAGTVKAQVLVMHGADDPHVSAEELAGFKREMETANVSWQLVEFGDAVHSFTVPAAGNDKSKGAAYDASADKLSWAYMLDFFEHLFT